MKLDAFFRKLARSTDRWAVHFCLVFFVTFILATYFTVQLYSSLKPDIEEMLPTTSRSVIDLKEVTRRLRAIDNLAVLIFSKDSRAAGRFQIDLAKELEKLSPEICSTVEYKITEELDFFRKRKSLFISRDDLLQIQTFIREKIEYEKFIYNPVNLVIEDKPERPTFDFGALERKYSSKTADFSHFPGGVYATPDGTKRLILAYVPNQALETAHRLKDAVADVVKKLKPNEYAPDLEVKYSNSIQDLLEEEASLMKDLILSTVVVSILVALVLLVYFRSLLATTALILSLIVGTVITLGLSYFMVGDLNANSAFLGSIIMGNGINFGIMVLARYLEERRSEKREHLMAMEISLRETFLPTFTAALAAAISYGSLMLTSFRGFSQFGVIGFVGMIACWFCAYTFLPSMLSFMNRFVSLVGPDRRVESRSLWSDWMKKILIRVPKQTAILGSVFTIFTIVATAQIDKGIIETDLTKLRDKTSMEEGSGYLSRFVDLIMQRYSTPIAVLTKRPEDAETIAQRMMERKNREGSKSMIANVLRIQDFVPPDQNLKVGYLKRIREQIPPKIFWSLNDADKAKISDFLSDEALKPFSMDDLPSKLLDRFREKDGFVRNLVLIEPPLTDEIRNGDSMLRFIKDIREIVDTVAPESPIAGRLPVSADMLAAVLKDGPIATIASALAVVILIIVLFRSFELSVLVLASLFTGVLWLFAILQWFELKINFLNFIALPITFGIGVDYAVNVFHRYREEKKKNRCNGPAIINAVYHTGGAVMLASATTAIGWSSLLIAGNQAFVSFGRIAMIGEVTCVVAAVLVIPATLIVLAKKS